MRKYRIVFFVLLFLLAFSLPLLAQEAPDSVGTKIDDWLVFASASITLITSLGELAIRYLFPQSRVSSNTVGGWVQAVAVIIFLGVGAAGYMEQLNSGVDFLNSLSGPLTSLAIILFGPDIFRPMSERKIIGRAQGEKYRGLGAQELHDSGG